VIGFRLAATSNQPVIRLRRSALGVRNSSDNSGEKTMKVHWVIRTDPVASATEMLTAAKPTPNSGVGSSRPSAPVRSLSAKRTLIAQSNSSRARL